MSLVVLIKSLVKAGTLYGVTQILLKGQRSKLQIKRVMTGIVMIMTALFMIYLGILALIGGLFFFLADLEAFIKPALITGGAVLVVALLVLAEGYRSISK